MRTSRKSLKPATNGFAREPASGNGMSPKGARPRRTWPRKRRRRCWLKPRPIRRTLTSSCSHRKVLVIGSDVMTSILDYTDRATCVLFGDGAGAVLLESAGSNEGILDFEHDVDGSGGEFLYMPGGGSLHPSSCETVEKRLHYVHQEGSQVFKYAVRRMAEMSART